MTVDHDRLRELALNAMHDPLRDSTARLMYGAATNPATILALLDELAQCRADAERYRFLREHWFAMGTAADRNTPPGCHYSAIARAGDVETLDAAIDRAREAAT